jgi:hypothetical protein
MEHSENAVLAGKGNLGARPDIGTARTSRCLAMTNLQRQQIVTRPEPKSA